MDNVERVLENFTEPDRPLRKNSHGLMLYGPPGTGKTQLCSVIIKKAGLFDLGIPPLSSSELNRSKVGETEKLLMALFHRAFHVKYLICCIAIDEIDALVPKRNDKSGEHKVDVLCLLLSLIGGIKDVPNIFVIASTNRLNKIDEAFARRLQDKFYVGRLNAVQRIRLIEKIKDPRVQLPQKFQNFFDNKTRLNTLKLITTNFSGAAMVTLRSQLLKFFDLNSSNLFTETQLNLVLNKLCAKVANDFQIKIGGYSIPHLLRDNNMSDLEKELSKNFQQGEIDQLSGRVLIDLRSSISNIQFELVNGKLKEVMLNKDEIKFTSDLVPTLLVLAVMFKVPYFQLIDSNLVLADSAFEQNTMIEMILEKLNEYEQYDNSMIVFDADTLVGISESMSDSSMSESLSYSIQNNSVWQQIILHSFKGKFGKKGQKNKIDEHKWCIFISNSEFLINQFKKLTKLNLCNEENELNVKKRTCENCCITYCQKDNKSDSCSFHPKKELERIVKVTGNKIDKISATKEELVEIARRSGNTTMFNDYYYLCCMKRLNESDGCKRDFHKEKVLEKVRSFF